MSGISSPSTGPLIDRDLYCLTCGYNLRGLSGDPVRCPECGNFNPVEVADPPARIIAETLKLLEGSAAGCLAMVLAAVPTLFGLGTFVARGQFPRMAGRGGVFQFVIFVVVPCVAVGNWVYQLYRFRRSCQQRPGWGRALLAYHAWGLLAVVTTIPLPPMLIVLYGKYAWRLARLGPHLDILAGGLALAVGIPALVVWVRWVYRRVTTRLHPLQRDVAVTIAREQARKRMAQQVRRRWG